jgi:hypothetical protein
MSLIKLIKMANQLDEEGLYGLSDKMEKVAQNAAKDKAMFDMVKRQMKPQTDALDKVLQTNLPSSLSNALTGGNQAAPPPGPMPMQDPAQAAWMRNPEYKQGYDFAIQEAPKVLSITGMPGMNTQNNSPRPPFQYDNTKSEAYNRGRWDALNAVYRNQ